jgi:hypothetical protein
MAVVSILEALALLVFIGAGFLFYRRLTRLIAGIEERQIAPVTSRVNAILDDVKGVSGIVRGAADSTDSSVRRGLDWLLRRARQFTRR